MPVELVQGKRPLQLGGRLYHPSNIVQRDTTETMPDQDWRGVGLLFGKLQESIRDLEGAQLFHPNNGVDPLAVKDGLAMRGCVTPGSRPTVSPPAPATAATSKSAALGSRPPSTGRTMAHASSRLPLMIQASTDH